MQAMQTLIDIQRSDGKEITFSFAMEEFQRTEDLYFASELFIRGVIRERIRGNFTKYIRSNIEK